MRTEALGDVRSPATRVRVAAAAAVLLAVAVLAVRDGTPWWQAVRLAVVLAVLRLAVDAVRSATVTAAAGVVGVAVGVGIAVPHLSKTGLSLAAVAGVAALAGGLALLVETGRAAPRRPRAAVGLLLLTVLGTYALGQAVAVTNVPRTGVGDRTPADLGLHHEDVALRTADGHVLSAWWVPGRLDAGVVLLHGAGSTRASVLDHAAVLARHGYGVLLVDARGHGRSGGRAMDFGWRGDLDVDAALDFLAEHVGGAALVGMSMGGEEAIGAAAADPRVRAVVAEGATGRTAADRAWLADAYGLRGRLHLALERVMFGLTDLLTSARPPISLADAVVAASPRPVLLIAAGDVADEAEVATRLQARAPTSVDVWVVPGAGHTDGFRTAPDEWERRVLAVLDAALR